MQQHRSLKAMAIALVVVLPAIVIARSAGPPARRTGAPGDQTCATSNCHAGTVNPDGGSIKFNMLSGTYTPGSAIEFEIEAEGVNAEIYGFQATARLNSDASNAQAGRWDTSQQNTQVVCENGSPRGAGSCADTGPIEFIQHNQPQGSNNFDVRWTPPDSDVGPITIYAAMNGANGNGNRTGDRIYTAMAELTFLANQAPPVIRGVQAVLQAFDNAERLSSGTYVQIFGENLSATTRQWAAGDFIPGVEPGGMAPQVLDGVSASVNGENAYVSYISPRQVNIVIPDGIGEGTMSITVTNANGTSNEVMVTLTKVSPAMQADAAGRWKQGETEYVMAQHQPDSANPGVVTWVGPEGLVEAVSFRPAKPGDIITVFVVGAGTTDEYPAGKIPATAAPLALPHEVRIGDMVAQTEAVANPQFVGLFQFNITVPDLAPGNHRITLAVDGVDTGQTLFLSVVAP